MPSLICSPNRHGGDGEGHGKAAIAGHAADSFAALFEQSIADGDFGGEGEIIIGTVVSVGRDHVVVDIGGKSEGVIPLNEFAGADNQVTVKAGDKVDVYIDSFGLEQAQVDQHRSTVKQITSTGVVYLKDPTTRTMLELYVQVGVLAAARVDEILNAAGSAAPETPPKVATEATGKV